MNQNRPPITHLLPIHNGSKFVKSALASIFDNSIPSDLVIVIEDGSTDDTYNQILKYSTRLPNLKILQTDGIGLVGALNLGIVESKTEWIARWDVDDQYSAHRISKQMEAIAPEVVAIFTDYEFRIGGKFYAGTIPSPIAPLATLCSLVNSQQTAHPSAILRRKAVVDAGLYKESEFPAEDLGLWLRLSNIGHLISIPMTGLRYNLSAGSISAVRRDEAVAKKNLLVKNHKVNFDLYASNMDVIDEILKSYKILSLRRVRTFLFFRNFQKACQVWHMDENDWRLSPINRFSALIQLSPWVALRRIFRKIRIPR